MNKLLRLSMSCAVALALTSFPSPAARAPRAARWAAPAAILPFDAAPAAQRAFVDTLERRTFQWFWTRRIPRWG